MTGFTACMSAYYLCSWSSQRSEEGAWSPVAVVVDDCEPHHEGTRWIQIRWKCSQCSLLLSHHHHDSLSFPLFKFNKPNMGLSYTFSVVTTGRLSSYFCWEFRCKPEEISSRDTVINKGSSAEVIWVVNTFTSTLTFWGTMMVLLLHALCGSSYPTHQLRLAFYESNVAWRKW